MLTRFLILFFLINCHFYLVAQEAAEATPSTCDCYSSTPIYNVPITFDDNVPGDLQSFSSQSQADCFAWQEFISLNWPVSGDDFGEPGDTSQVQWETYMPKQVMFQANGAPSPVWGTIVSDAVAQQLKSQEIPYDSSTTKVLNNYKQAGNPQDNNWLGAQNGTNVWYEIMLNEDIYNYVVTNKFYDAANQHKAVKAGTPINFPKGQHNGQVGAIELKAAWMEVTDSSSDKWKRYKISNAVVLDPATQKYRQATVALVGLHILHKTTNQPTWVWATFEHIDNVPDSSNPNPPYGYNFYNSNCSTQSVTLKDGSTVSVECTANQHPPYALKDGPPAAIQITRVNSIDQADAAPINSKMQGNVKSINSDSVWQYYQLVDVIWSQSLQKDPTSPIPAPRNLNNSSMKSGVKIVANTTLESYVQNTNTCFSCHQDSTIAFDANDPANNGIFSDFSFAIGSATTSTSSSEKSSIKSSKDK